MPVTTNTVIVRAKFETVRETAFGSITSSFTRIGTAFTDPFSIIYIQNFTDQYMDFSVSFEGLSTTFSLEPIGKLSADMITNSIQISAGESAWVKYRSTPPSSGFVQVSAVTPV